MLLATLMNTLVEHTPIKLIGTNCELTYEANSVLYNKALLDVGRLSVEEISIDNGVICASINDYDYKGTMKRLYNNHPDCKRKLYNDFYT